MQQDNCLPREIRFFFLIVAAEKNRESLTHITFDLCTFF